ncbi:MAG: peptidoglycan-associated lipoprotein Pal [Proteobacteria bacterium]|nr:peptidoglycan-associated lipoprotein Pal [Pseudomonadota bacterium]MBU1058290.1 peptidoglycan-associated lipoprotein Pal [Pseudomonadota bacterium]
MNPMIRSAIVTTALLTSLALLSTGCSKKSVLSPDSSSSGMTGGNNINYPDADSPYSESGLAGEESMDNSGSQGMGNLSINSGEDMQSEEYRRTHGRSSINFSPVYFDFDQAGVASDMQTIVSSNASYMKDNPDSVVVIEGNCDERGTNEYNLALGERRAINVKEYMVNLGVLPQRIRTVSYGEERPLFTDSNELDWAQNRRADTILE